MLVYLGGDVTIDGKEIIAILDSKLGEAPSTKEFLRNMRDEGRLVNLSEGGKRRSIVVTADKVFISYLSCNALKRRVEYFTTE
ncbi:extracellular matrix regulator RemB [Desulfothermobacter acidiphilus]|uniref:extracellular matrix regulator RemB n=1 Tax=Desulfothermobacter acidiphilus TaxID=1938353 RepID=UPI003F88E3EF